jgi:hypothetical protein
MTDIIFVVIEYNILHFHAVIQSNLQDNHWSPIFSVLGKFFAWELFVVINHLLFY